MSTAKIHPVIGEVTARIAERSKASRTAYLEMIGARRPDGFARQRLTAGNLAHATAGCAVIDKTQMLGAGWPNLAIISAYNDMLSAHQPFDAFPEIIRKAAREAGATAQFAGGVPAMCDGVTQGQEGMELSLFSRDVIAMASAVGLSHNVFDAGLHLGVCDKIIPGLVIAALRFGWLPAVFVPAGPMPSGLPNKEKARIRQLYSEGKADRKELLRAETESYHSPGTCTFYGTANSNQMLMEVMGFHLPGAAFIPPGTPLRDALTAHAAKTAARLTAMSDTYRPAGEMIDERSIVNAIVGLMATGGSTNHALHIPAMAAAAGLHVTLDDFDAISAVTPLLCRIYPNGNADVNHFHAAGGMGFVIRELIDAGLIDGTAQGVGGPLSDYAQDPILQDGTLSWKAAPETSGDLDVLRPASDPFQKDGGLRTIKGALGTGMIKTSAVKTEYHYIKAPVRIFNTQASFKTAFEAGELNQDTIIVVRFQGPRANGMPELHGLSPALGALQDRGFKVALVTDGRMSGASGKVPAVIHIHPEATQGGPLAKLQDGDIACLDVAAGTLTVDIDQATLDARTPAKHTIEQAGLGRELFDVFRLNASNSEAGGSLFSLLS